MGIVLGVILGGVVLAAIFGAMREKDGSKSFWGNPKQAGVLIVALLVLGLVVLWAVTVMNDAEF